MVAVLENLITPSVVEATGVDRDQLDYASIQNDIHVVVPDYGMVPGDSVIVYWTGTVEFATAAQKVAALPLPLVFTIPKLEVVDVIGGTATARYTVTQSGTQKTSDSKKIFIKSQAIDLPAPTINASNTNVRVPRNQLQASNTVRVYWHGVVERSTAVQTIGDNPYLNFDIPSAWAAENNGQVVLIYYTVGPAGADGQYLPSRLLRLDV